MATQYNHWKLQTDDAGRQLWTCNEPDAAWPFTFNKTVNANSADAVYRSSRLPDDFIPQGNTALERGWDYYSRLQAESGHWPGDYGGPMFLLPGLVFAAHVTGSHFATHDQALMKRYMLNHQNADGGWGMHIEGPSTMFGTVLQYVALRLLGEEADAAHMQIARQWILEYGGATYVPSWGKFYLSVLGLYDWEGNNSLFPEMWLLPKWLPIHPSNYWCHTRMVYLPMAYCFAHRVTGTIDSHIKAIREELYTVPYAQVKWSAARNQCAKTDLYYPQSTLLRFMNKALNTYEKKPVDSWRKKASAFMLAYINAEDEQTNFINIGPVNQVMNSICVWHAYGKNSTPFKKHRERWADYLWLAEDGLKMQGYNGSQLWDTAFAMQALQSSPLKKDFQHTYQKALSFVERMQVREEVAQHKLFFRHDSIGGWPFSNAPHGWPITDCTAEGIKCLLLGIDSGQLHAPALQQHLQQSCDLLLSFQNANGGWASYELTRGPKWLEWLNPAEVFGDIMIDYAYTECSSACVQALIHFHKQYHAYRTTEVLKAIQSGISFILQKQRADGSWYGSWAVCFTYGTWFACEALSAYVQQDYATQITSIHNALQKAGDFLCRHQLPDGGWGEHFESSVTKTYQSTPTAQAVNTAWAVMSLMVIEQAGLNVNYGYAIANGIQSLQRTQLPSGDFEQRHINGVFNHNCMISYTNYRNIFPLWALGRFKQYCDTNSINI